MIHPVIFQIETISPDASVTPTEHLASFVWTKMVQLVGSAHGLLGKSETHHLSLCMGFPWTCRNLKLRWTAQGRRQELQKVDVRWQEVPKAQSSASRETSESPRFDTHGFITLFGFSVTADQAAAISFTLNPQKCHDVRLESSHLKKKGTTRRDLMAIHNDAILEAP